MTAEGSGQFGINVDTMTALARALQSSRAPDAILEDAIRIICETLSLDASAVFFYEDGVLRLRAALGLEVTGMEITLNLGEGITGHAALQRTPIVVDDLREDERVKFFPQIGDDRYLSMISVPMLDEDKLVGVLNVSVRGPRPFSDDEVKFVSFVAGQLVVAIRNAQLYEEVAHGFREMTILHQVGQIVNSVLDLDELFTIITRTCAEYLSTRGSILRLVDEEKGTLDVKGLYGVDPNRVLDWSVKIGDGIAGRVAKEGRPMISRNVADDPRYFDTTGLGIRSVVCVPLISKGRIIGTLGVFDKKSGLHAEPLPFDDADLGLVSTIGNQVAIAIENARLYKQARRLSEEKDLKIRELNLLLEITKVMRSTLDLEETLYVILTSVTMGQGLGFNRAALFLMDESRQGLSGKMAVGPRTPEEASKTWAAVDTKGKSLQEIVIEYGHFNMHAGFEIDREIKGVFVPVREGGGLLSRTVTERRSFNVKHYNVPEEGEEGILARLGFESFAVVPLSAKDRVIGVMVVDNLVTGEKITEEDVTFLQLFANQAAAAIEMARVYKNLELTNRRLVSARDLVVRTKTLATLGEFSAGVAHELRNPLVSIGGFANRLQNRLPEDSREAKYARIIATEVERLEKILSQILDFVGGQKTVRKQVDVVLMLEEIPLLFSEQMERNNVRLETHFDDRVRALWVDEVQMRQVFINLVKNAVEAMAEKGGMLRLRSTLMEDGGGVGFEVSDTGKGISSEDLEHVFDPFFTKKTTGTGLGLSVSSRIVETNHEGRIFIDSKEGKGTSVLVWLPTSAIVMDGEERRTAADGEFRAPDMAMDLHFPPERI